MIHNKKPLPITPGENSSCCCYCYNTETSTDSRCCGVCYCCFPIKEGEKRFDYCPNNFSEYWDSCYVQTTAGPLDHEKNGICCWFCFFPKLGMFFPCLLGSLCNGCVNYCRDTKTNYLF